MRGTGRLGVGKGGLGKGALWDRSCGGGRRGVEVLREGTAEIDDGSCSIDGDACEEGDILAAVYERCKMGSGRMRKEDKRERRDLSVSLRSASCVFMPMAEPPGAYFSSSLSFSISKLSSHPTSTRIFTPPSSSSRDCDDNPSERAPCNGQKVNMVDY